MLEDDIETVENFIPTSVVVWTVGDSWNRIKKALESVKQSASPTNTDMLKLLSEIEQICDYQTKTDFEKIQIIRNFVSQQQHA